MDTSCKSISDDDVSSRKTPARFVNALVGALVTFFIALITLAFNAGQLSANVHELQDRQAKIIAKDEIRQDNYDASNAATQAKLSAIQQMQQDMSSTLAQMQAQMQAQERHGGGR